MSDIDKLLDDDRMVRGMCETVAMNSPGAAAAMQLVLKTYNAKVELLDRARSSLDAFLSTFNDRIDIVTTDDGSFLDYIDHEQVETDLRAIRAALAPGQSYAAEQAQAASALGEVRHYDGHAWVRVDSLPPLTSGPSVTQPGNLCPTCGMSDIERRQITQVDEAQSDEADALVRAEKAEQSAEMLRIQVGRTEMALKHMTSSRDSWQGRAVHHEHAAKSIAEDHDKALARVTELEAAIRDHATEHWPTYRNCATYPPRSTMEQEHKKLRDRVALVARLLAADWNAARHAAVLLDINQPLPEWAASGKLPP